MAGAGSINNRTPGVVFQQPKSQEVQEDSRARVASWAAAALALPNVAPTSFQTGSAQGTFVQPLTPPAPIVVPSRPSNPNLTYRPKNVVEFDLRTTALLIREQLKQYGAVNPELLKNSGDLQEEIKEVSAPGFVAPASSKKALAMIEYNFLEAMITQLSGIERSPDAVALVKDMEARAKKVSGELYEINLQEQEGQRREIAQKLQGLKF